MLNALKFKLHRQKLVHQKSSYTKRHRLTVTQPAFDTHSPHEENNDTHFISVRHLQEENRLVNNKLKQTELEQNENETLFHGIKKL